ncbi:DUF1499 domain-containing protein [Aliiroseovarius sp. YM-037]|uniref:DUF1499 domain-containing protein n=1 Tax=Aliiroseovarius sp. YM-037 TaxID=3341728 RepID=UPI003A813A1A
MILKTIGVLLLLFCAAVAYVRLAPLHPDRWHHALDIPADAPSGEVFDVTAGHAAFRAEYDIPAAQLLEAFDAVALTSPRTKRLAGSPEEGMVTYATRSRVIGFPDLTTASATESAATTSLTIHGRLRFGASDLGVNAARISGWVDALHRRLEL